MKSCMTVLPFNVDDGCQSRTAGCDDSGKYDICRMYRAILASVCDDADRYQLQG